MIILIVWNSEKNRRQWKSRSVVWIYLLFFCLRDLSTLLWSHHDNGLVENNNNNNNLQRQAF